MTRLVQFGVWALALILWAVYPAAAQSFTSDNGEVAIADFSNWEIRKHTVAEEQNQLDLRINTTSGPYTSVNINIKDIGVLDVFDPATLQRFVDALRESGNDIITIKPAAWDGRTYQSIFMTRLVGDNDGKPLIVFVQELMLAHNGRFHNITFSSIRDQPETNPALVQLLADTKIR